jgi:hypothetical protein
MVQIDNERAEPVTRRIEQLELKELEKFARRLRKDGAHAGPAARALQPRAKLPRDLQLGAAPALAGACAGTTEASVRPRAGARHEQLTPHAPIFRSLA